MRYVEITINTSSQAQELVADLMFEFSLEGVCILDKNDLINLNANCHHWDYIDDDIMQKYGEETLVKGYIKEEDYPKISVSLAKEMENFKERTKEFLSVGSLEITTNVIDGEDWVNAWKVHYKPIKIKDVVICPKWIDYKEQENEKKVLIDVGMAFGTGEHETTSLCVELMQEVEIKDKTVYDIGTGSGILGITAIKLGAKLAVMSDIDEIAVQAAKNNARINGVLEKCDITLKNLLDGKESNADVVVSNITAEVLIKMADEMGKITKSGTPLVLSGVLADRVHLIDDNYGKYFKKVKQIQKGDWTGLLMIRK